MEEELPRVRKTFYTVVVKRVLDFLISTFAVILLSPVYLILIILELIYHGSPVFFTQDRPGLHGEIFQIYKFRSMTNETDSEGNLLPADQRVTPFGRFIRRFSLDELPELFCIVTGKMSIIGPRPLLPRYLPMYTKRHSMRHEIRPGLACVPLKPMKTWTWNDQFENDIWYLENCSFLVDLRMIGAIFREAIHGAEYRSNATREKMTPDYWKKG
ncbi:MAG: sugar transferase [Solobacterium sp.]|nr:sugar transferase [Solobacterium sp.]